VSKAPAPLTQFVCRLPDGSKSALSIDGEGAGKLTLMLPMTEAQQLAADYHKLLDQALLVVIVPAPQ